MKDFQSETAQYYLPKAVLEEIPDQFMYYMNRHNIRPNPRIKKDPKEVTYNSRFDRNHYDEDELPEYHP